VVAPPAVEGALAKVERVMPDSLRDRVQAVEETLVLDVIEGDVAPGDSTVVTLRGCAEITTPTFRPIHAYSGWTIDYFIAVRTLSRAARERRRVWMRYRSLYADEETEREFDPYGLVYRKGRWYATGYCHLRRDRRLFRLDRMLDMELRAVTFERPPDVDPLADVLHALGSVPREWPVAVLLETTLEEAQRHVSADVATLEDVPEGILFRCYTDNLAGMARLLASFGIPLTVVRPTELRDELHRHADEVARYADRGGG